MNEFAENFVLYMQDNISARFEWHLEQLSKSNRIKSGGRTWRKSLKEGSETQRGGKRREYAECTRLKGRRQVRSRVHAKLIMHVRLPATHGQ